MPLTEFIHRLGLRLERFTDRVLRKEHTRQAALLNNSDPTNPQPDTIWLVIYECREAVVVISPNGKGFFAPGQEPCWKLENAKFIRQLYP